jgi:putative solute:sodium symporter small subunit
LQAGRLQNIHSVLGRKSYKAATRRNVNFSLFRGPVSPAPEQRQRGPLKPVIGASRTVPDRGPVHCREGNRPMATPQEDAHWKKTTNLMLTHLGIWFFFGYIVHMFVHPLNKIIIPILGFPLGFYMAAQGSLIVFVVMLFVFARQQDKIDREFGFAEDDA